MVDALQTSFTQGKFFTKNASKKFNLEIFHCFMYLELKLLQLQPKSFSVLVAMFF